MPMLMLMDKKMVMMYYWFESMSRPPEIDQPKVRRLGEFKSAAMITFKQHYCFLTRFLSFNVMMLIEGLNICIAAFQIHFGFTFCFSPFLL